MLNLPENITSKVNIRFVLLVILTSIKAAAYQENAPTTCADSSSPSMINEIINTNHEALWKNANYAFASYVPCSFQNCSCYFDTLENDLRTYKEGITRRDVEKIQNKGTKYLIYKSRIYRGRECSFPARCSGVEHFLKELSPKLPDVEFVVNLRDWPQISKHFGDQGPVFSFSKTNDYFDIQYPAWSFWEGGPAIKSYPRGLGRWDLISKRLIEESLKWPWERKEDKGFFRGSRTSAERDSLVLLSRSHSALVDAQYTKNQAWKSPADTLHAEPAEEVSLEDHCRYKYLFNFRGVAASFRLKHLFLCGSTVVHFGEEWTEFFYNALKPWVHYVPMAADSSEKEILQMLEFLKHHDELAKAIAARGKEFIQQHLRMKDIKCYWRSLLRKYSKLLKYSVTLDKSLIEVT